MEPPGSRHIGKYVFGFSFPSLTRLATGTISSCPTAMGGSIPVPLANRPQSYHFFARIHNYVRGMAHCHWSLNSAEWF